jgi:hypothetical protein
VVSWGSSICWVKRALVSTFCHPAAGTTGGRQDLPPRRNRRCGAPRVEQADPSREQEYDPASAELMFERSLAS